VLSLVLPQPQPAIPAVAKPASKMQIGLKVTPRTYVFRGVV
jgi:hypothetical protein